MGEQLKPDLCVIGAGSGGLSVAAAASQLGASVVLIEKGLMGGDCLNQGCVPSKSLIAAARRAHLMRTSHPFGIMPVDPVIDPSRVRDHVREVIGAIAPNDSAERYTGFGARVLRVRATFADRETVLAGDTTIRARHVVIATGSLPAIPPIPGLDRVPFLTNETIFEETQRIAHLIVIGGGPIGIEIAQAHARLGARVTVLEAMKALAKDDPELSGPLLQILRDEGIDIIEDASAEAVELASDGGVRVTMRSGGKVEAIDGSHLLLATGREPNIEGLGLDAAGVKHDRRGIFVNDALQTSNRRIFAIGDVVGGLQFTHLASHHASVVVRRALFRLPAVVEKDKIPWVTFTDPELAHVGLMESEARQRHGKDLNVLRWPFAENDRAQADRETQGFVKAVTTRKGKILGATILGAHAGELIHTWSLAVSAGLSMRAMTAFIAPYPTLSEINKRVAYSYYVPRMSSPLLRGLVGMLRRFG